MVEMNDKILKSEAVLTSVEPVLPAPPPRRVSAEDKMRAKLLMLPLTKRQGDIAVAVALGGSNKVVANKTGVSEKTVKFHLTTIFKKLAIKSRIQLALILSGHEPEPVDVVQLETK